jgi:hypothetical protein
VQARLFIDEDAMDDDLVQALRLRPVVALEISGA